MSIPSNTPRNINPVKSTGNDGSKWQKTNDAQPAKPRLATTLSRQRSTATRNGQKVVGDEYSRQRRMQIGAAELPHTDESSKELSNTQAKEIQNLVSSIDKKNEAASTLKAVTEARNGIFKFIFDLPPGRASKALDRALDPDSHQTEPPHVSLLKFFARSAVEAKDHQLFISDKEWPAILDGMVDIVNTFKAERLQNPKDTSKAELNFLLSTSALAMKGAISQWAPLVPDTEGAPEEFEDTPLGMSKQQIADDNRHKFSNIFNHYEKIFPGKLDHPLIKQLAQNVNDRALQSANYIEFVIQKAIILNTLEQLSPKTPVTAPDWEQAVDKLGPAFRALAKDVSKNFAKAMATFNNAVAKQFGVQI